MEDREEELFWAAYNGNVFGVNTCLARGVLVNCKPFCCIQTPLHMAKTKEVAANLIQQGADVNSIDSNNQTPLHEAQNKDVTEILIQNGADVKSVDINNQTPLHVAKNIEVAEILIQNGADVYSKDSNGRQPLHYVEETYKTSHSYSGETEGDTALHAAASVGEQSAVKTLISLGANVSARNIKGKTPYDLANDNSRQGTNTSEKSKNYIRILEYLEKKMNTSEKPDEQSKSPSKNESPSNDKSSLKDSEDSDNKTKKDISLPWLVDAEEFERMLSHGEFLSYENRLSLGGPCKAGKSTLASVLIGEKVPLKWNSTDGLVIYFGKNGIDIDKRKMVPFKQGERGHDVLAKILRGKPDVCKKTGPVGKTTQPKATTFNPTIPSVQRDKLIIESTTKATKQLTKATTNSTEKFEIQPSIPSTHTIKEHDIEHISKSCMISKTAEMQSFEIQKMQLQSNILEEVRNGQYRIEIAPSDLIDFGGQKSYDMTHQLFIQHTGSFLLMFDGRKGLHDQLYEYPEGVTAASILKHWVDSILTYTEETEDIMPMILFAATHRDLCKRNTAQIKEGFISDLVQMFSEHEKKHHIHLETVYFINGIDKNDTEIQEMTDQVVWFAMQQSSWGQRRPMQWVPLQMQIGNMRLKNINIITKEDLQNVNLLNDDLALNERQLNDFLLVQHSLGKLMYYDLHGLNNFIIIHPPALVNILRSFVTDEKFFPTEPNLRFILQTLSETGRIYKTDLLKLWQQEHFYQYMPDQITREFVVKLLVHLDILIIPKVGKETSSSTDVYLVPCMIKAIRPTNFNSLDRQEGRTICLRYTLSRHSIPTALAYKIIGAAINAWPLKEENQKPCLYYQAAVFNVNEDIELRIWLEGNKVIVYMTNQQLLLSVSPDFAASVQECLKKNLESSILFHYNSFGRKIKPLNVSDLYDIELGTPCGRNVCFKSSREVMEIDSWMCRKKVEHGTRYLRYWIFDKTQTKCGHGCTGLNDKELNTEPSDKHLVRLGSQIGMDSFRDFCIYLGMEQKDFENTISTYDGHSSEGKMSMALKQWKMSQLGNLKDPTLKDLSGALEKAKIDSHLICQIFRENTELFDKADFKLQSIPSDFHLKELSNHIGNCPLQLGVELGLSFIEVEQSLFSFPKDLPGLVEDILKKWRKKSKVKTIIMLMMALQRVKAGGVRYLRDIS